MINILGKTPSRMIVNLVESNNVRVHLNEAALSYTDPVATNSSDPKAVNVSVEIKSKDPTVYTKSRQIFFSRILLDEYFDRLNPTLTMTKGQGIFELLDEINDKYGIRLSSDMVENTTVVQTGSVLSVQLKLHDNCANFIASANGITFTQSTSFVASNDLRLLTAVNKVGEMKTPTTSELISYVIPPSTFDSIKEEMSGYRVGFVLSPTATQTLLDILIDALNETSGFTWGVGSLDTYSLADMVVVFNGLTEEALAQGLPANEELERVLIVNLPHGIVNGYMVLHY